MTAVAVFGRTPRLEKFGLVVPAKVDREELAKARSKSHKAMRERSRGNRRLGQFANNDRILLQDNKIGRFDQRATVVDSRDRRSEDPRSYYVRKDKSGEILLRNRRHFQRLPSNTGPPVSATEETPARPAALAVCGGTPAASTGWSTASEAGHE